MKDLLVFVTPKQLLAYDMTKREYISIDGQNSLEYVSNTGAGKFCDYLRDNFNIDSFDEMDSTVTVVRCGGKVDFVEKLFANLHGCKGINVIDVEKLLPMVADTLSIKKGEQKYFSVMGAIYRVKVDKAGKVVVAECDRGNDIQKLQPEDFSFICNYSLQSKWDEEKETQYNNLVQSEAELRNTVDKLTTEKEKLEDQLKTREINWKSLRKENKELKGKLNEKSLIGKRTIWTIKEGDVPSRMPSGRLSAPIIGSLTLAGNITYNNRRMFLRDFVVKNGSVVKKGDIVAKVSLYSEGSKEDLLAPATGRILLLREKGEIAVGDDYAIIYDPSDDVDNVMDWYKGLRRKWYD